jgi:hypothetical protein
MTDNPIEILRDAGVECAEVDEYALSRYAEASGICDWSGESCSIGHEVWQGYSDATVLALARLVHRYKWQRDDAAAMLVEEHCGPLRWVFEELDRDYAEYTKGEK